MLRNSNFLWFVVCCVVLCWANDVSAQLPSGWRAHDLKRPAPPVVTPGPSNLPLAAPDDAIVLFDGKDLSQWRSADGGDAKWKVVNGAMESVSGSGYLYTREEFGDCQLHVEWAAPVKVEGDGQGRGNSGVYLMGMFEIQVLDSFNNPTYADGTAGSIYGQYPPLVNACRKPGEWQSYDIIFKRPRFDGDKLTAPAYVTVLHNGVLIQNHSEAFGPSQWILPDEYSPIPDKKSLSLQDHGNPVRYRNIWIRPQPDPERPLKPQPYEAEAHRLSDEMAQKLLGQYGKYSIVSKEQKLFLVVMGRHLELMPASETEFGFRKSAGSMWVNQNDDGSVASIEVRVDAAGGSVEKTSAPSEGNAADAE